MELNKAIKSRHSVRKFKDKKPNWRDILEAIDSARYAPMAGNNFTLKFILVSDKEKIQKITDACEQDFVGKAKYLVVVCSNPSRTINTYDQGEVFVRQQAGAGIQNFLLKLQELGLSTCWIGYFTESQIKKTLKIPEHVQVEAVFPIGYELKNPKTRRAKIDLDNILFFEQYDEKNKRGFLPLIKST